MQRTGFSYAQHTLRNRGFVPDAVQEKIRNTTLMIAGCGLGSAVAEVAVRAGFTRICLVDGDSVEAHNLNRQVYTFADVGRCKAQALADRIRAINPDVQLKTVCDMLDDSNIPMLVGGVDLVIDTVDFLDAVAILRLHAEARLQRKFVIAPLSVGWGGACLAFSPSGPSMSDLAGLNAAAAGSIPYSELFAQMLERYASGLPDYVLDVVRSQMAQIRERKPCPISQLSGGNFCAASLAVSLAVRVLAGESVPLAPAMLMLDPVGSAQVFNPAVENAVN